MILSRRKIFLLLAISLVTFSNLFAQYSHWSTIQYKKDRGLPNNLVKSIAQDSLGIIWAATNGGVARIEGITFEPFYDGLPSLDVKSLFQRRNGNLLAITDMGIAQIFSTLDTAYIKTFLPGSLQPSDSTVSFPKSVFEDRQGRLWVIERNSIALLNSENKKLNRYSFEERNRTFDFLHSFSLAENGFGELYAISLPGYLYHYNERTDDFEEVFLPEEIGVAYQLMYVSGNRYLLATSDGLFDIRIDRGDVISFELIFQDGFSSLSISTDGRFFGSSIGNGIFEIAFSNGFYDVNKVIESPNISIFNHIYLDRNYNIWASTNKGIFLYPPAFFGNYKPQELPYYINDLSETWEGDAVLVTQGESIYKIQGDSVSDFYSSLEGNILKIMPLENEIWIATANEKLINLSLEGTFQYEVELIDQQAVLLSMTHDKKGDIWGVPNNVEGVLKITPSREVKLYHYNEGVSNIFNVVKKSPEGDIYLGGNDINRYLLKYNPSIDIFENLSKELPSLRDEHNFTINDLIVNEPNEIFLATNEGLMLYNADSVSRVFLGNFSNENIQSITEDHSGNLWLGTSLGVIKFTGGNYLHFNDKNGLTSEEITPRSILVDSKNHLWLGTSSGIIRADELASYEVTRKPIIKAIGNDGNLLNPDQFSYELTSGTYLQEEIICLQYPSEHILYQFRLLGGDNKNWSVPSREPNYFIPKLSVGEYTLEARARQQGNYIWSDPVRLRLSVALPWHQTWWAFVLYALGIVLIVFGAVKWYTVRLVKEKAKLEEVVSKRTEELVNQKKVIEKSNEEITASINYAKRIQLASLPQLEELKNVFQDAFIFYRPRDIVSGDFYWFYRKENLTFLAAADCTGHGVPGAFMSIAGETMLSQAIEFRGLEDPAAILKDMHLNIRRSFKQAETKNRDGMDISLCVLNHETGTLHFTGAQTNLLYIQKGEMHRLRGDRQPVGGQQREKDRVFHAHEIDLSHETTFYMFSDGYQDQFGGPQGKKFMAHRFRQLLLDVYQKPMNEQNIILSEVMNEWIAESNAKRQTDDMLVIGVKV